MNMHARHFVALAAVCGVALAADSYVPAPIPQDFGIHASKSAEPVVYTEFSGELINAFDRNIVERQCQMGRELGLTNKTPVFEAGYDKPNKFESQRFTSFTNEQHSATYTVTLAYGCDRTVEKAGSSADAMCDCTYRVLSSRRAEIKNRLPDGLEIIVLDPQKQVAERPCREEPPDRVPGAWRSRRA